MLLLQFIKQIITNTIINYPQEAQLYNVLGEKVMEVPVHENKFSMNVADLPEGTYFLKIISDNKASSYKIIVGRKKLIIFLQSNPFL